VIFVVVGLQNAVTADTCYASKIELVNLLISENVVVIEPPIEPEPGAISPDGLNLG
jgi:hypothetical protein